MLLQKIVFWSAVCVIILAFSWAIVNDVNRQTPAREVAVQQTRQITKEKIAENNAQERGQYYGNKLEYFQDSRTGLCFAFMWVGDSSYGGPAMSNVSCTEDVKKLVSAGVRKY